MIRPILVATAVAVACFGLCPTATMAQEADYERFNLRHAADFLPPELRKSELHQVGDEVLTEGYQHHYTVQSEFGTFGARGDAMLRRLVREIHALAAMREVTKTQAFKDATTEVLKSPFLAMKGLATNPVGTVTGVPKGIGHVFTTLSETMEGEESEYEDNELEALLTLSKFKRQYAAQLGIDVYTSNEKVQEELNRIGWAAVIGNLGPSVLTAPLSGPAIAVTKSLDWVKTFNDMLLEKAPSALRHDNETALEAMGVDPALADRFLDHPLFSPRHSTLLTQSLASLDGTKGRTWVVEAALNARTEEEALFYQQVAETLAGVHRASPLVEIRPWRRFVVARDAKGHLLVPLPIDEGRWTRVSGPLLRNLAAKPPIEGEVKQIDLWVTGLVSDRLKAEASVRGLHVVEDADTKLGMMD